MHDIHKNIQINKKYSKNIEKNKKIYIKTVDISFKRVYYSAINKKQPIKGRIVGERKDFYETFN